jgi:hypothetical protein
MIKQGGSTETARLSLDIQAQFLKHYDFNFP